MRKTGSSPIFGWNNWVEKIPNAKSSFMERIDAHSGQRQHLMNRWIIMRNCATVAPDFNQPTQMMKGCPAEQ